MGKSQGREAEARDIWAISSFVKNISNPIASPIVVVVVVDVIVVVVGVVVDVRFKTITCLHNIPSTHTQKHIHTYH